MPSNEQSTFATELIASYEAKKNARAGFNQLCIETAERCWPEAKAEFTGSATEGQDYSSNLNIDSTARIASGRYASILDNIMTPRNSQWHRLAVMNPELAKLHEVRDYFDRATDVLFQYRYSARANFASQNFNVFRYNAVFGNGPMFTDKLSGEPGIRYKACGLGSVFISENHQGLINSVYRCFKLKAQEAVQLWPDTCPEKIKNFAAKGGESAKQEFDFLHVVVEKDQYDPLRIDFRGMKFGSYYLSIEGRALLEEKGYRAFPYSFSRHINAPGEIYARSPAMEVMSSIRTLNEQKKTVLKQGHRVVDPVMLAFDNGLADRFSLRPGVVNAGGVSRDGRPLLHTLPTGNIAIGKDMMDDERQDIRDVFLINLFQILTDTPQKTATEVLELVKEKGILMSSAFNRQESEYLSPTIERELDILRDQNLLPPAPGVLIEAEGEYQIVYDSPFSRTQRAEEAAGLMRVMTWATEVANVTQDPQIFDQFDFDKILPDLAYIHGVKTKWLASPDKIKEIRDGRAAAAQRQEAIQASGGAAALIKSAAVAKEKAPEEYDAVSQAIAANG